jgi:hypothetical protein
MLLEQPEIICQFILVFVFASDNEPRSFQHLACLRKLHEKGREAFTVLVWTDGEEPRLENTP